VSTPFQLIHYEERGAIALITYDRQERRNAWNVAMYRETVAAVERANANDAVRAIIITNAGPVFCSGFDTKAPPEPVDPATGRSPRIATLTMARDQSWVHLMQRSKPVIAAINGAAIGAGATQLLPVDIRIASDRSSFSFPFVALGHMPEIGSTALLPRIVGLGRAIDIYLTAAKIDAAEALRIGLVTRVVEEAKLLDASLALANQIASYPSLQIKLTKGLLYGNTLEGDPNLYIERETQAFIRLIKARKETPALTEHPPKAPENG
jgi:enoyl-CoA hydratase/carnithine racemase